MFPGEKEKESKREPGGEKKKKKGGKGKTVTQPIPQRGKRGVKLQILSRE